ncbi:hypothetical protein D3C76_1505650 [compost metagenome]
MGSPIRNTPQAIKRRLISFRSGLHFNQERPLRTVRVGPQKRVQPRLHSRERRLGALRGVQRSRADVILLSHLRTKQVDLAFSNTRHQVAAF